MHFSAVIKGGFYPPILCKKYADTSQIDKSQETVSELIIMGGDAAKLII